MLPYEYTTLFIKCFLILGLSFYLLIKIVSVTQISRMQRNFRTDLGFLIFLGGLFQLLLALFLILIIIII